MSEWLDNEKKFSKSKHFHSLYKDKNKYKKKLKYKKQNKVEQDENEKKTDIIENTILNNEEIQEEINKIRGKYSKRKIENNSYKYKELEINEDENIPYDLKELLSENKTSLSNQFRFIGEKEWDDDDELLNKEKNLSLLEIDYNKLKKNLEILPLGQLLYIENKFLTQDLLESKINENLLNRKEKKLIPKKIISPIIIDKTTKEDQKMLDNLLELSLDTQKNNEKENDNKKDNEKENIKNPTEELENWLDSVI